MKLRTKFLISLCGILFIFGFATVQAVRRICEIQIRQVLLGDLRNSTNTFRSFQRECDDKLMSVATLMASMPALKALMTSRDVPTIQDGSEGLWRMAGTDLLVLADPSGRVVAVHSSLPDLSSQSVGTAFLASAPGRHGWSLIAGHLFETFSAPIYFGPLSDAHEIGVVHVGYEINDALARRVADIAASEVAFQYGDTIVSTTLTPNQLADAAFSGLTRIGEAQTYEVRFSGERFLVTSLGLSDSPKPIHLVVLKSFDQASFFLRRVNQIVAIMNMIAILIGCGLVILISRKFTKPLDDLMEGVQALERRDFSYPLSISGNDEFAKLTRSFDRMRSNLATAEEKLLGAERSATIGRMASSISHDLRHRLTSIIANSEFLSEPNLSSERKLELYENVRIAVVKMTDLLESLQEFSRTPDSLRLEYVSIEEIIEDSIATIRLHPQFQNVVISVEGNSIVWGWFDPKALDRGFYNLLLNACEVVPRGAGLIKIKAQRQKGKVEIRVSDDGPGIADCIRETLFQPFVSHGKQQGSGLGLAIVQKACTDHGGSLVLEKSSSAGTTFLMILPIGSRLSPCESEGESSIVVHQELSK